MSLKDARAKLAAFNSAFTTRMEEERNKQNADLRAAVDREVWALSDLGWSVNKIAKEYGTKDWPTVNRIVQRKPVPEAPEMGEVKAWPAEELGWIWVTAYDERVSFQDMNGWPYFGTNESDYHANGPLATALREDADFYAKVMEIVANNDALEG